MPKRSRADDPTSVLISRIPRPIGSGPLPQDLPAEAWARLFAVALLRLQQAQPGWASATAAQVEDLLASWLVFVRDSTLSKPELDMRLEEVLEHLEAHSPARSPRGRRAKRQPKTKSRPKIKSRPRTKSRPRKGSRK